MKIKSVRLYLNVVIVSIITSIVMCTLQYAFASEFDSSINEIDNYLNDIKSKIPVPGFSVVVVKDNKILLSKGYGVEVFGKENEMSKDSSVAIGSLTKSFTSLAVMKLVDENKIDLNEPVYKYIKEFKTANIEESKKITVKMLLSNTTGIKSNDDKFLEYNDSDTAMDDIVKRLSSTILNRKPGESYEYSNEGFVVAGVLIERVSGQKYKDYIYENILKPLEMNRSSTDVKLFDKLNVLYGHKLGIDKPVALPKFVNTIYLSTGSEFRSSSDDLGKYLIMLLNNGKYNDKRIISEKSIDEMWTPKINFPGMATEDGGNDKDFSYGYGWMMGNIENTNFIFHGGNTMKSSSFTMIDKEKKIGVSILMNANGVDSFKYPNSMNISYNIYNILNGKEKSKFFIPKKKDPSITDFILDKDKFPKYIGKYVSDDGSIKLEITKKEEKLVLEINFLGQKYNSDLIFMNDSIVYIRNKEELMKSTFNIAGGKTITGLNYYGMNFVKVLNDNNDSEMKYKDFTFNISNKLKVNNINDKLEIQNLNDEDMNIILIDSNEKIIFEKIINKYYKDYKVKFEGDTQKEQINGSIWNEKSYVVYNDKEEKNLFLAEKNLGEKNIYILLKCDKYNFTNYIINDVLKIMGSIEQ